MSNSHCQSLPIQVLPSVPFSQPAAEVFCPTSTSQSCHSLPAPVHPRRYGVVWRTCVLVIGRLSLGNLTQNRDKGSLHDVDGPSNTLYSCCTLGLLIRTLISPHCLWRASCCSCAWQGLVIAIRGPFSSQATDSSAAARVSSSVSAG